MTYKKKLDENVIPEQVSAEANLMLKISDPEDFENRLMMWVKKQAKKCANEAFDRMLDKE